MDAYETIFVQIDVTPSDIVRWLHAFAGRLADPHRGKIWVIGPRSYEDIFPFRPWRVSPPAPCTTQMRAETDAEAKGYMHAAPVVFETVALYALPVGRPLSEGEPALSLSFLPLYRRRLVLELRCWFPFSLALETVARYLAADFPRHSTIVSDIAPPQPEAGAPPLLCNSWLEMQLLDAPSRAALRLLYPQWLEQYRAVRGYYPAEPYRSFRAAVSGCRKRIRAHRARKQVL